MTITANAVAEPIAPPAVLQTAPPRADDGPRFQDHLDSDTTSNARNSDQAAQPNPKNDKSSDAAANASAQTDDADDQPDEQSEPPAHPVLLQVAAEPPASPQPSQPPVQAQAQTPQQPEQVKATTVASAQAPEPQPHAPAANTMSKPTKSDGKGAKPATANTEATQQPASENASESTPTPVIAQTAAPTATQTSTPPANDTPAVGAVQADSQRAPTPASATPPAPQATPSDNAPKADPKAEATRASAGAGKPVVAAGAKSIDAEAANFKDLVGAAHADNAASSATASAASSAAAHAASQGDSATTDLSATRAAAAPVASQVAREIVRRANGGNTRFEVRLDPAELGKIQVRLDVSRDHKVTAVVSADNPQALSELSRGARDLQQALQSAGLDLADDGLSFDLSNSQNGFSQPDQSDKGGNGSASARGQSAQNQSTADTSPRARPLSIESWRGSRIDVMA